MSGRCEITKFPKCSYALQEGYNTLSTNLTFSGTGIKKVMITSCHASEGKSMTAMNLMRTLTQLGNRVVLVDADLRRSQIRAQYGVQMPAGETRGLAHYLAGMCDIDAVVYETNIPKAYLVPVGRDVKNSLQLLSGSRMGQLLDTLSEYFDYVIIDAPPVGVIIDAAQIAKNCDGILLVVRYKQVSKKALQDVCTQLQNTGCPILGAVLNDVETDGIRSKYYYKKGYYAYYDAHYDTDRHYARKKSKKGEAQTPDKNGEAQASDKK